MAQPNMAVILPPIFSGDFLEPEVGFVFPQEDTRAYLQVQVGPFVPHPPVPQKICAVHDPWHKPAANKRWNSK